MEQIDYRELLVKYMAHVICIEGTAYVRKENYEFEFTDDEKVALEELEESADSKYFGL